MSDYKKWTEQNPVTDELLLEFWERFVYHISSIASRTYKLTEEDREDLIAEIKMSLLKLSPLNRPFEGYIKTVINNGLRDALRKLVARGATPGKNWKSSITMDFYQATPRKDGEEDTEDIDRALPVPDSPEHNLLNRVDVSKAVTTLQPEQRLIVELYFGLNGEEVSLNEIGKRMGMSYENARVILRTALRKLNRVLSG
jgi:RNA polymerase sigma factor (sigma-70 family)